MYQPNGVWILCPGIFAWPFYLVDCLLIIKANMQILRSMYYKTFLQCCDC